MKTTDTTLTLTAAFFCQSRYATLNIRAAASRDNRAWSMGGRHSRGVRSQLRLATSFATSRSSRPESRAQGTEQNQLNCQTLHAAPVATVCFLRCRYVHVQVGLGPCRFGCARPSSVWIMLLPQHAATQPAERQDAE